MFTVLKELNLTKLFILAIIIRLLIMPFYFHQDIKTYNWQSSFLKSGVFNIYTYLTDNKEKLPLKEEFVYFPLTYLFLGTYQAIVSPVMGSDFNNWLSDASSQVLDRAGTFKYLFILKFPYLILDLIIPFLIIKFFKDIKQKRKAFIIWLFNPISLTLIYIFSNVDIIAVILSLISILLFRNKKIFLSGLILGLAAGFKAYPLLFLPFLLLFTDRTREVVKMVAVSLGTLILIILPFWSQAFLNSALISGLTTRIAYPSIPLGFGESLMVGVLTLVALFFAGLTTAGRKATKAWLMIFIALLFIFSGIHFHIQWLLWIIPFVIIFYSTWSNLGKISFLWLILAFTTPLLYDDKSMSISIFSSISSLFNLLPTPFLVVQRIYDPFLLQGLIHSSMFGISLILVFKSFNFLKDE